jgi:predicted amidohydrolase
VLGPDGRFLNHSAVIDGTGTIRATYDKVHLFDVAIEGQAPIGESKRFAPGRGGSGPGHALGSMGPVDLLRPALPLFLPPLRTGRRQPHLHPAAFTVPTGRAHWEVLIRARAIETGAFVLAAAQSGTHADGRETWGHALAVDPGARSWPTSTRRRPRSR